MQSRLKRIDRAPEADLPCHASSLRRASPRTSSESWLTCSNWTWFWCSRYAVSGRPDTFASEVIASSINSGNHIRLGPPGARLDLGHLPGQQDQWLHGGLHIQIVLIRIALEILQIDPQGGALSAGAGQAENQT